VCFRLVLSVQPCSFSFFNLSRCGGCAESGVFAGFSYGNYELIPGSSSFSNPDETISGSSSARLGLYGWNGSVAVNVNRWFSFATDFSGLYSGSSASNTTKETLICGPSCTETVTIVDVASRPKVHNFLFGPQFSCPRGKIRPFAHFLLGMEHLNLLLEFPSHDLSQR
jgi:hypothetical protein